MAQHKWAKEIIAWANGAEIEWKYIHEKSEFDWHNSDVVAKDFDQEDLEFRIKPQPKEPQYLYVFRTSTNGQIEHKLWTDKDTGGAYIGKIKLEIDDE